MKILFDHQTFNIQKYGGISRYFAEVMLHLYKEKIPFDLSLLYSENQNLVDKPYFQNQLELGNKFPSDPLDWLFRGSFPGKGRLHKFVHKGRSRGWEIFDWNRTESIQKLQTNSYTIFHPTYYHDYYLPIAKEIKIPVVLTVYDMIHELFPQFFHPSSLEYATKHKTILASNKIVAISQSTKNDIIKIIGLQEEKIDVIHLASSLRYNPEKDQNTWRDYIFYVGDRGGYKNFIPFVKSISHLLKKYKLSLICAGANQFTWKERFLIYQLGISKFVKHIPIQGESHLASLYKHALFFVFPSLYEGFGIPLLESMNIGCPVVCSNTSSFPEVAGDAALYFDSNAVDSISSAIQRMIESDSLRKELSEKGKIQSQKFSWEKTSQKHLELYKKLS